MAFRPVFYLIFMERVRIDIADVLRGLAVMGIVILHSIEHFNFYSYPDTASQGLLLNVTDRVIWDGLFFALGGKAYAVFALLFGFSFFIQDDNQRRKGKDFRLRFLWRLLLLFVIGNINAMFFTGEILVMYSLVGVVLVLACRLSDKAVWWLAVLLLLQPVEWTKVACMLADPSYQPGGGLAGYYFGRAFEVQSSGTFWETVKMNLWDGQLASLTWAWEHGRIFQTAALFLLGMLIGRKGLFLRTDVNLKTWLNVLLVSTAAFFPLKGLCALFPDFVTNRSLLFSLNLIFSSYANFAFMLMLVSGVILVFYTTRLQGTLMKLSPYGRMSLTNYLTQSMVGSLLFYHWGFALHQHLGITYSFLVGLAFFLLQFAFCSWWMKQHRHGPFEYAWKKATWIGKK